MNQSSLYINDQWVPGEGEELVSENPFDASSVWHKKGASAAQVLRAVKAAKQAQSAWAAVTVSERIAVVTRFAELLEQEREALSEVIALETGKPDWEAATEVGAMINKVAISIHAQAERAGEQQKQHLHLVHRPHGVMAVFGPYNFPGHLPNGHIVPALLAGNSIVFKPSEMTPWVAELTVSLWQQAGLPGGVINLLQGGQAVGKTLAQADIDGVLFTGSSHVGKLLHQQMAGRPEVLLALEMGGNNPLIVDRDIHIDTAVNIILQSAYLSAGQRCTCARRLILVNSGQSEALLQQLQETLSKVIVGAHDAEPEPFMGPVINQVTAQSLLSFQAQLVAAGGKLLHDMTPDTQPSNLLKPGLIDVTDVDQRTDDEWFGPLLQIIRVADFDQAMAEANNTRFGLAAGLISDNPTHQQAFCAGISAGVISVNRPTAGASSDMPFGGVGASGNHRPSAYYAADYCAWPQAQSLGQATELQSSLITRGIRS